VDKESNDVAAILQVNSVECSGRLCEQHR
jgi:hypothetical protein